MEGNEGKVRHRRDESTLRKRREIPQEDAANSKEHSRFAPEDQGKETSKVGKA